MTPFIEKNNEIGEGIDDNEPITPEDLKLHFPPLTDNKDFDYSGKCNYCDVEINFSDTRQIKIKVENKEGMQMFSLYHKGCYDRYLRRTID